MFYIYNIMSRKSEINVDNKTNITEIRKELAGCKDTVRYYERLIAMEYILEGHTIKEASEFVNVSYNTVHRWAKICEKSGLSGLKPNFGGGRPSNLSFDQLVELDQYILKQIGVIVKKLGYNYSKAYPRFSKTPDDAEEQLKKT